VAELVVGSLLLKDSQAYGPFVVTSAAPLSISAYIACIYPPDACTLVQREKSRKQTQEGGHSGCISWEGAGYEGASYNVEARSVGNLSILILSIFFCFAQRKVV
jgi:hypothetical protein